jgi:hypothetical protein
LEPQEVSDLKETGKEKPESAAVLLGKVGWGRAVDDKKAN